jgi:hypothetical protein
MKKFVFAAFFAVCSIGFATSEVEIDLVTSIASLESTDETDTVIEYLFDELRCYERTCKYVNGERRNCTPWVEISCADVFYDTLPAVVVIAPRE